MRFVKTVKTVFTAVSVVLIAAGAALLVWPDASASLICGAMGVVAILAGAVRLAGYFSNDLYRLAFQFDLAVGVLSILLGGILLLRTEDVLLLLPAIAGLFILVDSVLRLQTAIDAKHFGMDKWWAILLLSAAGAALGLLLLLRPFQSGRVLLVRLLGLTLAADGAENLLACRYTVKVPRRSAAETETASSTEAAQYYDMR